MSPCERTAWIRVVSILIVYVPYVGFVSLLFAHGDALALPLFFAFIVAAVLHGLVNGIAEGASHAIFGRPRPDERDRTIEALSLRIAYFALISLLLGALPALGTLAIATPPRRIPVPSFVVVSQFVFCCIVVTELTRHVVQVVCYRRDARA